MTVQRGDLKTPPGASAEPLTAGPPLPPAEPLLLAGRIDQLRAALAGSHAAQWRRLYQQCDWYRGQTPPAQHPTASITYFGPAAMNLALAHRLTGQRGYLDEAWRWIGTAVSYPHWGRANLPDHDLDAGWLLHGLSLAYSWLRPQLTPRQAGLLHDKLALQGERLYEYAVGTEGRPWSSAFWQNHNWICYAGLATAGYVLGRPEWTQRAKANFDTVLDLMPADGSDYEGVVYWRYGVPWLAVYLDLLQQAEGVDWWQRSAFLRNTFGWRLHQCAPGFEEHVGHGDCHDRRSGHSVALYYKLAGVYRLGQAKWLADLIAERFFWREAYASGVRPGVLAEAGYELLWYDPTVPASPPRPVDTTAYFPDLGQVTARTGWDPDATLVSFKASPGGGHGAWAAARRFRQERGWQTLSTGHHHPDSGSFVLVSHGAPLVVDDGYNNRKRAAHHNTVLVDGQGWAGEGRYDVYQDLPFQRQARLRDVLAADGFAHATAEVAAMYDPALGVRRCDRTLVCTPAGRLVLLDELAADEPREWTLLVQSDWPADLVADDLVALRSGPAQAWLRRLPGTSDGVTVTRVDTEIEANPTSSTPSLRLTRTLRTLRASTPRLARARFLTAIEPTSALNPALAAARAIPCVAGHGVTFGDESVLLADGGRHIRSGVVMADAVAVILAGARGIGVVAATRVTIDGRVVLDVALDGAEPFTGVLPCPE